MRSEIEKEYLLKAVDASNRIFFIISPDFQILATNRYTKEKHGFNIVGKKCHQLLCEWESPGENCPAKQVLKSDRPVLSERPILREKENTLSNQKWSTCRYSYPIFSEDKIDAVAVLEFDTPSREEMEEDLRRANSLLKNLILSSVDGVIAADMTGKILIFNDAAVEISGYSAKEALDSLDIRDFYQGDTARDIMRRLRSDDYGGKGKLKSFQVDVIKKNGDIIPIRLNASIVYKGDKEVASIGFFHDLREELRIKGELEKTQIQLLQAEKMSSLGKLSAGVAHQLNNPLGGITLYTKFLLEDYDLEQSAKDDLNRILQEAERCRDTVKELLEFARQTSHLVKLHNLNEAISRTMFLLENQTLFQNISIEKKLSESLPLVHVDIQQMNHVFMNIILNAAQAMDGKGHLRLSTGLSEDGNKVIIEISDTGPGIPDHVIKHIFEPFFTTKEEGKGTGLGLSMVYSIVQDHGGVITVKSCVGEGTTFRIELPLEYQNRGGTECEE
ncbi:MAG: PAS domain-containing sensor histidine kinase [Desulfobacterium sp.]|nr:PAS domain-containing sensor histidine kinase [Desulfobacterium sp.]